MPATLPRLSLVTPVYNEEETLPRYVYRINGLRKMLRDDFDLEFVIVDDGSTDRTKQIIDQQLASYPDVAVVSHEANKGFGAALRTGLSAAKGDIIVTIDADTNYDHFEVPAMLQTLSERVDIVTASPWHPDGIRSMFPKMRALSSIVVSWLYRRVLLGRIPILSTYSSGFRVYRRSVIESVEFQADDFLATAEILIRAMLQGFRVREFPTAVYPRMFGESKLKMLKTTTSHLRFIHLLRKSARRGNIKL